jgi:hypothetical protein
VFQLPDISGLCIVGQAAEGRRQQPARGLVFCWQTPQQHANIFAPRPQRRQLDDETLEWAE